MFLPRFVNSVLATVLGFSLVANLGCSPDGGAPGKQDDNLGSVEAPITPEQLAHIYQQKQQARYVGKALIVRGKIQYTDTDGVVALAKLEGDVDFPWFTCTPQAEALQAFRELKLGEIVTVKGVGNRAGDTGVYLRECTLLKQASK